MASMANGNVVVKQFDSIASFVSYINSTPTNRVFGERPLESRRTGTQVKTWAMTESFDEAIDLMANGWSTKVGEIASKLEFRTKPVAKVQRNTISVAGFQPIVPLYIAGVPTNMVNKQLVAIKQKVVDVVKLVNYDASTSAGTMVGESVKALQVVTKLESLGYRCNLFVALGTRAGGKSIVAKIKVKSANERLSISKLCFPMAHPSMLRRLLLRFIEVLPETTQAFKYRYGVPIGYGDMCSILGSGKQIVLPSVFDKCIDVDSVCNLDDIRAMV